MSRRTKIIIAVVALLAILLAIYFLFFRHTPTTPPTGTLQTPSFPSVGGQTTTGGAEGLPVSPGFFPDHINATEHSVVVTPRLVKITDGPVALGVAVIDTGVATSTSPADVLVRYVERASGNAYEYRASTHGITRITNRTIPGVIESSWLSDGSYAFLRYLSENDGSGKRHVETYALSMTGQGKMLSQDLAQAAASGSSLVMVSSDENGSLTIRSNPDGTQPVTLFTSTIQRLFVFPTPSGIFVQTPASSQADSYMFSVGTDGALTRIPAPTKGLTALPSPSGKLVLVSYADEKGMHLGTVNGLTSELIPLPVPTITEKCVWSADSLRVYCGVPLSLDSNNLPDDWYQGKIQFKDRIWEVDFATRLTTRVADIPKLAPDATIDAVGLGVDPSARLLVFMNRNDGSLWAYSL